jgi:gliding motility-associated-like protein
MNSSASGNDFALDDISFAQLSILRDSVIITVDTPSVKTNNDTTICVGTSVPLTAVNKNGGTWLWSPVTGLSGSTISNPIATPAANTEYIVTGTDIYGCVAKDTVNVNLFVVPAVFTDHEATVCPNTPTQLTANSSFNSYSWSPAASLNNATVYNPLATIDRDTKYRVTIKDANSCTYIDSIQVNVKDIRFAASPNTTICEGDTAVLIAKGGDAYQWTPATSLTAPNSATTIASPTATTTYSVHIAENTCSQATTLTVTVGVKPSPTVTAQKSNDINCTIHTAKLTATGALSYVWNPMVNLDNANIPNPVTGADTTTTYYVMGTNEYGCTDTANVTVYVTSSGSINFLVPNAFTPNGDGHNDCFGVKNWGGAQLEEFQVFNRWGQRVFSTTNPNQCWDGRFGGQMADPGGYVYVIRAKTICGTIKRTGMFMLIR